MGNKRTEFDEAGVRLVKVDGLCAYTSMGKNKAMEFAERIGAKRKFGKSVLYDLRVVDAALDGLCE